LSAPGKHAAVVQRNHGTPRGGGDGGDDSVESPMRAGFHRLGGVWAWCHEHPVIVSIVGAVIAAVILMVNLPYSPDFEVDEVAYAIAGQHVGSAGSVSWDTSGVVVHPPIFFISLGAWLSVIGKLHVSVLSAIHASRYFSALCDIGLVILVGVAARAWSVGETARRRGKLVVWSMALILVNGFMLRFGRTVLIEPMAVFVGFAAVLVAWRLRHAPMPIYIGGVGAAIGIAVLTKEPAVFIAAGPVIGAILTLKIRDIIRNVAALLVGAIIWLAFPLWVTSQGNWGSFYDVQLFSIRRLLGIVQVTGLNQPGASPLTSFIQTFWEYVGGYLVFGIGAVALAFGVFRLLRRKLENPDGAMSALLGVGVLSYAFLIYSVGFGQSNQQLSLYPMPAAVLLALNFKRLTGVTSLSFNPFKALERIVALTCLVCVGLGLAAWFLYFWPSRDDATALAANYINNNIPACALVNATGDEYHWRGVLRRNPLEELGNGPNALAHNVHVFLLSPKDVEFHYGPFDNEYEAWLKANGREVFFAKSHTYQSLSVWIVGDDTPIKGLTLPSCVSALPKAATDASAGNFGEIFGGFIAVDALAVGAAMAVSRRRTNAIA
jgi:hypothetical protein